ncbi:MAG: sulfite exporter TauE/SafE family protein [Alkalibacterium sp.]|uniref:Probable membrane transporter protein n=1 Tax=Alkalibacterium gilvum TaxID=1130080 RepID=A0A1H6RP94_9LACT|nr:MULTISPECIES: sulfite exporter TauE/SafE family protein [Alkalibacterium]MDN6193466.1 sulfite exporter TauE/SafE family protein [Alkalibacterium sp.]MDN6294020.1 sulfite exporter TauE/SafE family protein [Alkalibacterium sp.]MDN6295444.1 sulfite exporter TauE/SafE family protein [Alkalibacterium sp.]MDN6326626.1 sulfite exporter TauE/SafE family protein [Alkalibacterium sp.]MDN6385444.1 sulfite exporter TauE/SafE family protein [Alkalibacterium sp.]
MDSSILLLVIGAVFLGSLMRSTLGFGDSVVSMPLLALLPIPFSTAVSLVGLVGCTVALLSIFSGYKNVDKIILKKLSLSTLLGIPFGLLLVQFAEKKWISLILGLLLISYSIYSIIGSKKHHQAIEKRFENTTYGIPFGFFSGMLGSAYNMNGIPIVLYGTMSNWSPNTFKDTLQTHFLFSSLFIVLSHFLSGFWTRELGAYFLWSLPAIFIAIKLGNYLYSKIDVEAFKQYVLFFIFILGLFTLFDFL